jgi:beta-glucosidase
MSTAQSDLPDYPFRDPRVPPEQRISRLIALLTLDEKIALLSTQLGVPRLASRSPRMWKASMAWL